MGSFVVRSMRVAGFLLVIVAVAKAYKAAVVEFTADHESSARVQNNLNGFRSVLDSVRQQGVQIIVFPEGAIIGVLYMSRSEVFPFLEQIPDVRNSNPIICDNPMFNDRTILRTLSCFARDYGVVLVANMGDKQECNGASCPRDGHYQFNTNVVFETDGRLIAKYHKQNLFAAEKMYWDAGTSSVVASSFSTSFGVTFGTFTCFDILSITCSQLSGIHNFIFPTAWGNNYPFYMSIAIQQSWSRKNRANLLAANQNVVFGSQFFGSGSGIYSNGFAKKYYISGRRFATASGQAIISDNIPDDPRHLDQTGGQNGIVNELNTIGARSSGYLNYNYQLLPTDRDDGTRSLYSTYTNLGKTAECMVEYKISILGAGEQYSLGAYIGSSERNPDVLYAVCSFVKNSNRGAGYPPDGYQAETVFERVILNSSFQDSYNTLATALTSGLVLLEPTAMVVEDNRLSISGVNRPLLSATLWSRVNSSRAEKMNAIYLLGLLVVYIWAVC